ncbi:MAG: phosphopantetheine-binding protein [Trueperella sp.]|nr:phosphopantetheine-binding protein [Trueperella sp.]
MGNNYHPKDVALARTRVALAELAPEVPETEIIFSAGLRTELGLDELTIWALAANLEKLAKVQIADADIAAVNTVSELCELAISDVPFTAEPVTDPPQETTPGAAPAPASNAETNAATVTDSAADGETTDVMAAAADLAKLFNN